MTCHLSLHILDRKTMLPLDFDLPFGCAKSAWGDVMRAFFAFTGRESVWSWHSSEDELSVDGVRCWWTDSISDIQTLAEYLIAQHFADSEAKRVLDDAHTWLAEDQQYRFFVELV